MFLYVIRESNLCLPGKLKLGLEIKKDDDKKVGLRKPFQKSILSYLKSK